MIRNSPITPIVCPQIVSIFHILRSLLLCAIHPPYANTLAHMLHIKNKCSVPAASFTIRIVNYIHVLRQKNIISFFSGKTKYIG